MSVKASLAGVSHFYMLNLKILPNESDCGSCITAFIFPAIFFFLPLVSKIFFISLFFGGGEGKEVNSEGHSSEAL